MGDTVELPLWLAAGLSLLALVAMLDRLLVPGLRWMLRRRLNRVIDDLNAKLQLKLPAFKLTKRQALIDRLVFDPQVIAAMEQHATAQNMPREAVMRQVEVYAREIVPAFNAYFYFRIGYWLARRIARALYRVRVGYTDDAGLAAVPRDATVIFVMNHRSNMDYVLVAYLAADQAALSYAVGEWARVWPLQSLIRAMGAYFIRRNSSDPLYRRVLERYVQMATEAGVPQAVFPEGGLTLDGRMRVPKLGLLDYIVRAFDPVAGRDVVFVPIGINYDRVLEDRSLLRRLDPEAKRVSGRHATATLLRFVGRNLRRALGGRWYRFGYACVNFGTPVSLRDWLRRHGDLDLRRLGKEERGVHVTALGTDLMAAVGRVVPVLPVALVAEVLLRDAGAARSALEVKARCLALIEQLETAGARIYVPRGDLDYSIDVGLRMLTLRRILSRDEAGLYRATEADRPVLRYYANSIAHLLEAVP